MMLFKNLLFLLLSTLVLAKTHHVSVGKSGLSFTPSTVHAKKGDNVAFTFIPGGDHGVASSAYGKPCQPNKGYIWSGFVNTKKTWTVKVKDTKPMWIYCPQSGHCQAGMSMVINPSHGQSLGTYKKKSAKANTKVPKKKRGGHF